VLNNKQITHQSSAVLYCSADKGSKWKSGRCPPITYIAGAEALKMCHGKCAARKGVWGSGLSLFQLRGLRVLTRKIFWKQVQTCAIWCIFIYLLVKSAFMGCRIEVCMGVENHNGMWFPRESHGSGNSHMAYKIKQRKRFINGYMLNYRKTALWLLALAG